MTAPQSTNWFEMKTRGKWIIAFFAVAIILMGIGAASPVNPTDARSTYDQLQKEAPYIDTVQGIFGNNFFYCLIMFAPFIGPLFGAFIFFNMGVVIAIIAIARGLNAGVLFSTLFLFPHTWLELLAYSFAMSQSVFLAMAIVRGRFKQELARTCVIITVSALILVLAAIVEVILITTSG